MPTQSECSVYHPGVYIIVKSEHRFCVLTIETCRYSHHWFKTHSPFYTNVVQLLKETLSSEQVPSDLLDLIPPSLSGMYQDVQGQLSNEEAFAYPRASCARLRRVWQSLCGELKTEEASTRTHWRETLPGQSSHSFLCNVHIYICAIMQTLLLQSQIPLKLYMQC